MGARNILLVSGLHANERSAPLVAEQVYRILREHEARTTSLRVPYEYTLLANLDEPEAARPDYCMAKGGGTLDVDLTTLVGDEALRTKFPGYVAFEFHCSRDVWTKFAIDPRKPVEQYEVGVVMPVFTRPYEIGTWRNVLPDGTQGKHVIEVPAVSVPVSHERVEARMRRLEQLAKQGYLLPRGHIDAYLFHETDVEVSRQRGLVEGTIPRKIARWILSVTPE
jgi:hypothetical protein